MTEGDEVRPGDGLRLFGLFGRFCTLIRSLQVWHFNRGPLLSAAGLSAMIIDH